MVKLNNFSGETMRKQLEDKKQKLQTKIDKIVNDAETKLAPLNKQMETTEAMLAVLDEHETRPDNVNNDHIEDISADKEKLSRL